MVGIDGVFRGWVLVGVLALIVGVVAGCGGTSSDGSLTFTRDVAPLLYENCALCHRPGESAPFSLLTYQDAKKHDKQMAQVTASGFMPPWLPEPGYGEFVEPRHLTEGEIEVFRRWYEAGSPEGDSADLPAMPQWVEGWQLGEPDLVVEVDETYTLPSDGIDIFRNLVIPIPTESPKWVKTIELRPGNPRVVHHAIMRVDNTRSSRMLDAEDEEPGYGGMRWADALPPEGHFLGWTPGQMPYAGTDDLAWKLKPGSDLVVQLHMLPTGKPETIRPKVGIHFADKPPTRLLDVFVLKAQEIDIAPGVSDYVAEDSFKLPVDLEILSIYPHAHYLGKEMEVFATLPDGKKEWLIRIPDWDFNWQDQYYYVEPVFLPAGATIAMRYVYDNSADNVRNPNIPPKRVTWGDRSTDEMGTLSLEVIPKTAADLATLRESILQQDLRKHPAYAAGHNMLGTHLMRQGDLPGAARHLMRAIKLRPDDAVAQNNLGKVAKEMGQSGRALQYFEKALELRPDYADALYNKGTLLADQGNLDQAIVLYRRALEISPYDAETHNNLAIAQAMQGKLDEALPNFRRAVELDPGLVEAIANLGNVLFSQGHVDEAIAMYRRALELRPDSEDVLHNLRAAEKTRPGSTGR